MWNIIWGIIFVIGGASGRLVLRGTDSCSALIFVGVGLIVWGVVQIMNASNSNR